MSSASARLYLKQVHGQGLGIREGRGGGVGGRKAGAKGVAGRGLRCFRAFRALVFVLCFLGGGVLGACRWRILHSRIPRQSQLSAAEAARAALYFESLNTNTAACTFTYCCSDKNQGSFTPTLFWRSRCLRCPDLNRYSDSIPCFGYFGLQRWTPYFCAALQASADPEAT